MEAWPAACNESGERVAELGGVQGRVQAPCGQQLLMGAALDDGARGHDEDEVRVADRGQPVGDDQRGPPVQRRVQGLLHGGESPREAVMRLMTRTLRQE